jgi:hypothetical protein
MDTFKSWYEGYFKAAIGSSGRDVGSIQLLMRHHDDEREWRRVLSPQFSSSSSSSSSSSAAAAAASIEVRNTLCFEKLYKRKCKKCFYGSISPETARNFKKV